MPGKTSTRTPRSKNGLSGFPPTFVAWGSDEMFRDPIRRFVVMLDKFLKFAGGKPFAFATGANFDRLAVVFGRLEDRAATWAFHNERLDGGCYR